MRRKRFRRNNSGQLLILSALAVAILTTSTLGYIYELERQPVASTDDRLSNVVLMLKQGSRNTVIESLANISISGDFSVLSTNLDRLSGLYGNLSYLRACTLESAPLNDLVYESGTLLSWNDSGQGVSASFVNFTLGVQDESSQVSAMYAVNITSAIVVNGSWASNEAGKLVSVSVSISDESGSALAQNISAYFFDGGNWSQVSSNLLSCTDFGNGTYQLYFETSASSEAIPVSIHVIDAREILVIANTTCLGQVV